MAKKPTLNADGLQTYLGAVAASGIGSGLPVFWAIGYLSKQANSNVVNVQLQMLERMTGYNRKELTGALKSIRLAGHQIEWTSRAEFNITIDKTKGLALMGPWMHSNDEPASEPLDLEQLRPPVDRLNELMGTRYPVSVKTAGMLRSRLKIDKMTIEDLIHVVEVKCEQWKGNEDMEKFLRPSTLFGTKAVEYAQERKREEIAGEKKVSKEDLSRMFAG